MSKLSYWPLNYSLSFTLILKLKKYFTLMLTLLTRLILTLPSNFPIKLRRNEGQNIILQLKIKKKEKQKETD